MERTNAPLNGVSMQQLIDLNDVTEKAKDDVFRPDRLSVQLCFQKEDMQVLKQKYKVLGSSEVTDNAYFENLGFEPGTNTLMLMKDKRARYHGTSKSLQDLARSWFKTDVTEREKPQDLDTSGSFSKPVCASMAEGRMEKDKYKEQENEYDADIIAATEMFRDFIKQANNDPACNALKKGKEKEKRNKGKGKGKEKVEEHGSYTSWPPHGKKKRKYVPKMRTSYAKLRIN